MLKIIQIEQIDMKLREASSLIDFYEKGDFNFPEYVEHWLKELEQIMSNNRLSTSGSLAAYRGILLAAKEGIKPIGIEIKGRFSKRKLLRATSIDIIYKTVQLVEHIIQTDRIRIHEGEQTALQLIAHAKNKGMIKQEDALNHDESYIKYLMGKFHMDENLKEGMAMLESRLGAIDSIIALDRNLNRIFNSS